MRNKGFHIRSISSLLQCPPFRLSYQNWESPCALQHLGHLLVLLFTSYKAAQGYLTYIITDHTFIFLFCTVIIMTSGGFDSQMNCLPLSGTILSASILVGFTTSLILFCSHFHQVFYFYNNLFCI